MNFKLMAILFILSLAHRVCNSKSIVTPSYQFQLSGGVTTKPPHSSSTKPNYVCQCEDKAEPLCANNGVTYKNKCRFECAKHKVERLRIVKEGDCGKYMSKLQYWSFG